MTKNSFGKFYEDFIIGERLEHWPGKTVTESDNNLFSLLTMNHHPVHIDKEYKKKKTKYKKNLVVGTYTFSLIVGLTVADISGKAIANLNYHNINHEGPVFIGDTLYAKSEIVSKKLISNKKKGIVKIKTFGLNQNKKIILSYYREILVPLKKL